MLLTTIIYTQTFLIMTSNAENRFMRCPTSWRANKFHKNAGMDLLGGAGGGGGEKMRFSNLSNNMMISEL